MEIDEANQFIDAQSMTNTAVSDLEPNFGVVTNFAIPD
jgi:hypothetical protein